MQVLIICTDLEMNVKLGVSGRIRFMRQRVGVVGLISNGQGEYLICKMPVDRGVYPGQWGIPGGGWEEGETIEETLLREMNEEVGLVVSEITPWHFKDDTVIKLKPGKDPEKIYYIYLMFKCRNVGGEVRLNEEFEEYRWVSVEEALGYDLNRATRETFERLRKE